MPRAKVAIWNIENFGDDKRGIRGQNCAHLAAFVRAFVVDQSIDVLIILEALEGCLPALQTLANTLNLDAGLSWRWRYDLVKGVVLPRNAGAPNTSAELDWASARRREGYAVLWKESPTERLSFEMGRARTQQSEAPDGVHALELVWYGRPYQQVFYNPPLGMGYYRTQIASYDPTYAGGTRPILNGAPAAWEPLPFITSSTRNDPLNYGSLEGTRRPCTCTIILQDGSKTLAVPIVGYHAPLEKGHARAATYRCSMSAPLYIRSLFQGVNPVGDMIEYANVALMGGDFNVRADKPTQSQWYQGFTAPFSRTSGVVTPGNLPMQMNFGGANMTSVFADTVNSVVFPDNTVTVGPFGQVNMDEYLRLPIDRAFVRNQQNGLQVDVERINLVDKVYVTLDPRYIEAVRAQAGVVEAFQTVAFFLNTVGVDPQRGPIFIENPGTPDETFMPVYRWSKKGQFNIPLANWPIFRDGVRRGHFSGDQDPVAQSRAAAEFIRITISDHMPLVYTLTWGDN